LSRRDVLRLSAGAGAGAGLAAIPAPPAPPAVAATAPIVKPLPPELFNVFGSNAEMRWEAMRGQGYTVPIDRFFVRNHTDPGDRRRHLAAAPVRHRAARKAYSGQADRVQLPRPPDRLLA
jgi:hypothetical protein